MMKVISKQTGLHNEISNHSIRTTSFNGDIVSVSGQESESSINSSVSRVTYRRGNVTGVRLFPKPL